MTLPGEIEGDRLLPFLLRRIDRQGAATAGAVDENIGGSKMRERLLGNAPGGVLRHHVLDNEQGSVALGSGNLRRQRLEQFSAPANDGNPHAFGGQAPGDGPADAHRRAGHHGPLVV